MQNATVSEYDGSLPTSVRAHDLSREIGGGGVRDRVVRVHDVEMVTPRDLHDLRGERQRVLGFTEQRVGRRRDGVEGQSPTAGREAERRLGAEHVHVVTAVRQIDGQFRRDDPAAAGRRVTDNADVHGVSGRTRWRRRCRLTSGSRTTNPSAHRTPTRAPNCASRLSINC